MAREVVYVIENASGNYDVFINGREKPEAKNLPYEAAVAKAKKILNGKDSGDDDDNGGGIIIEKRDGSSEKIPPEKAKLDKE